MSTKDNKYSFELCKRRGIKDGPHPIVTDFKLLKAMAANKNIAARSKETRQKTRGSPLKRLSEEDIQQHAVPHQVYTYEQLLQNYQSFFQTGPLMRCLDDDKNIDERLVRTIILDFTMKSSSLGLTRLTSVHELGKRTSYEITGRSAKKTTK